MRDLHARMLGAVLGGEGLHGVAELASAEAGGPVAIVLPARGLALSSPEGLRVEDHPVELEVPVAAAERTLGAVQMLGSSNGAAPGPPIDREEIARAAAVAVLAEVAVTEARDEVTDELRASLIEDLRASRLEGEEVLRRATRLGTDLAAGGLALVAEIESPRPLYAAGLVEAEWPSSLAELAGERVYAILPARAGADDQETLGRARSLVGRLRGHGPAAMSSLYGRPGELHSAVKEAELVLEVVRRSPYLAGQIEAAAGDGVYRLLFRALVSHPEEVRIFFEETVAAVVEHDRQYRSDLLDTLDAYLAQDCNMNATARAIFAHRHTVAYRLDRVRELTGLDPASGQDRERLGLGIKAYRILAPSLPR